MEANRRDILNYIKTQKISKKHYKLQETITQLADPCQTLSDFIHLAIVYNAVKEKLYFKRF